MFNRKAQDLNDQILVFNYPYANRINPVLFETIKKYCELPIAEGGCLRSNIDLHHKGIKEVDTLLSWVEKLIPSSSYKFVGWDGTNMTKGTGGRGGYDPYGFAISSCWGMLYNEGSGCVDHNHFPYPMAFVYYINTPSGGPPTLINNRKVRPQQGQLLLFMGHLYHGVPISKVDGRCVLAGLITYVPKQ